jgi:toxin ParE1/3/4
VKRRLVIRPKADIDLDEQALFIGLDSIDAAIRFYGAATAAFERLLTMPELGVARPLGSTRLEGLRMWPIPDFPNYLIFYLPSPSDIEIVRVLHGARDIPEILEAE